MLIPNSSEKIVLIYNLLGNYIEEKYKTSKTYTSYLPKIASILDAISNSVISDLKDYFLLLGLEYKGECVFHAAFSKNAPFHIHSTAND